MNQSIRRIISPDTQRDNRLPPGQTGSKKWPVLHYGPVPDYSDGSFDLKVFGQVQNPLTYSLQEVLEMPRVELQADMHCVTTWSVLENTFIGIAVQDFMKAHPYRENVCEVVAHSEYGFSANIPIEDFMQEDVILALEHNGEPLTPEHGYPLRLLLPRLYLWKSVKWLRGLEFVTETTEGFWERNGYHCRGNPWAEERMKND